MPRHQLRFILRPLQFVEQAVEDEIQRVGIQRVPPAVEILAFAQQQAAERQAVQLLFAGQLAGRKRVQALQRRPPQLLLAQFKGRAAAAQFAARALNPGTGRPGGIIRQGNLEMAVQQVVKLRKPAGSFGRLGF